MNIELPQEKPDGILYATNFILKNYSIKTMRDDESIWMYQPEKGYYVRGESYIKSICANSSGLNKPSAFNALLMNIQGRTYCNRDEFLNHEGFLNLKNGVLDIKNRKLLPHDPDFKFLNRLEINYDPKAKCPTFDQYMKDVLGSTERALIQKWFAYHFQEGQPQKKALFLLGYPDTGKSTLLNILEALLGKNNICHFQLSEFDDTSSHSIPSLFGKTANIYADMGTKMIQDVGKFKVLTGNDSITTRQHYKEPFSFTNNAKLTFSCNKLPRLADSILEDDAFWNRVIVIVFENPIPSDKQIPNLSNKIINNEMSGILNWALEAYMEPISKGESKLLWLENSLTV